MRGEKEMFDLILGVAERDNRIRAVIMNGSRAITGSPFVRTLCGDWMEPLPKAVKRDCFQDYDIGYLVTDITPFYQNISFIRQFGELLILQMPESSQVRFPDGRGQFMYLAQFTDGTRIDLNVGTVDMLAQRLEGEERGEPMVALLDKDQMLPPLPGSNDAAYHIKPPDSQQFSRCCNEFFWLGPYIAKALWRDQIPLAMEMLNHYFRSGLQRMLHWHIGIATDFSVSAGKSGSYYKAYLDSNLYNLYISTFPTASSLEIWNALFTSISIFRALALETAAHFGFSYNSAEEQNVLSFLRRIYTLPPDATNL